MRKVDLARWERYFKHRNAGDPIARAAKKAHLGEQTAYRFEAGDPASSGIEAAAVLGVTSVGGKVTPLPLSDEARTAIEDFGFFRRRYFGRNSMPWQERAAYEVLRLMATDDREYVVMNEPPGAGKSTLFTHDLVAWLIARDRTIRILLGSRTGGQARLYLGRLKRTLERDVTLRAPADALALGTAFDAEATMAADFGTFVPERKAAGWSSDAITVRQTNGMSTDDKEATAAAFGQDEGFLGGRYDLCVWDDLVDRKNVKGQALANLTEWWMTNAETRLEPGGLLLLQGQRIAGDDLYRFCLDMKTLHDEPKYQHVVYPAHDESVCEEVHDETAKPWPEGCLLDPVRLPWKDLATIRKTSLHTYDVQYQQNDGDAAATLVQSAWLRGETDSDGYLAPGCYDNDRPAGHAHPDDVAEGWSVVCVDPSPTNFWAVGWWLARPEINRYVLVEGVRAKMGSEQFLSMNLDTGQFSGLLEELRVHSVNIGAPITHVVVEYNAAQRYLVTQPHVHRWQSSHGVTIVPHQTSANKNDPTYGVTSIADYFRQGAIRIPLGDTNAREFAATYAHELTHWPDGRTDDTVMMTWFLLKSVQTAYTPRTYKPPTFDRPDFLGGYHSRGLVARRPPRNTPADRLVNR